MKTIQTVEELKAPFEWHAKNFILGMNLPSWKKINAIRMVEDSATGEVEEVKSPVGYRGAVASGKRQKDGTIKWDWNLEEEENQRRNLLDFYVINIPKQSSEEFYRSQSYVLSNQSMEIMPKEEEINPLMIWKKNKEPSPEEWQILTDKAVANMREADVNEETINNFINERCK